MKKFFSIVSILIMASMILAACATTATAPPAQVIVQTQIVKETVVSQVEKTVVVNKEITATPVPGLSGIVRIGTWDSADALIPVNTAIKRFEALYPNVDVQLESVPADYGTKLLAQAAAGNAPDIFQVGDGDPSNFASKGMFEPLTDYISGKVGNNPLDMNVFYPAMTAMGNVQGTQYLLTAGSSPLIIYYNKTLFDAAKVDYPTADWTWADLLATAQKLTVKDASGKISQWGLQLPDSWGDLTWTRGIQPIIYENGGSLLGPDGKTTTGYLNSDATVEALQWYFDLSGKYKVAPTSADVAALSGQDLFATGKVAMMWTGIWGVRGYMANPKLNFGMAQLPVGKERGNSICWAGYAMYSKSPNKEAAWAFLKWMGAEGGAEEMAKVNLTPVKSIAELQGLTKDPYFAPIMADLENVKPLEILSNLNYNTCVDTPLHDAIAKYLLEGGDLKAILTDIATKADVCLAK